MPPGSHGIVVDVRVFNRHGIEKDERSTTIERAEIESIQEDKSRRRGNSGKKCQRKSTRNIR